MTEHSVEVRIYDGPRLVRTYRRSDMCELDAVRLFGEASVQIDQWRYRG